MLDPRRTGIGPANDPLPPYGGGAVTGGRHRTCSPVTAPATDGRILSTHGHRATTGEATDQRVLRRAPVRGHQLPSTSQRTRNVVMAEPQPVTAPSTMRAVSQDRAGAPDVLKVVETRRPEAGRGEILVRVQAAGVNPADWKTRARGMFATGATPPFTLGFDVAGIVESVNAVASPKTWPRTRLIPRAATERASARTG